MKSSVHKRLDFTLSRGVPPPGARRPALTRFAVLRLVCNVCGFLCGKRDDASACAKIRHCDRSELACKTLAPAEELETTFAFPWCALTLHPNTPAASPKASRRLSPRWPAVAWTCALLSERHRDRLGEHVPCLLARNSASSVPDVELVLVLEDFERARNRPSGSIT